MPRSALQNRHYKKDQEAVKNAAGVAYNPDVTVTTTRPFEAVLPLGSVVPKSGSLANVSAHEWNLVDAATRTAFGLSAA